MVVISFFFYQLVDTRREIFQVKTLNRCVSTHDFFFVTTIFAYKGCILVFGMFLAWSTRNIRITQLNDSKGVFFFFQNMFEVWGKDGIQYVPRNCMNNYT